MGEKGTYGIESASRGTRRAVLGASISTSPFCPLLVQLELQAALDGGQNVAATQACKPDGTFYFTLDHSALDGPDELG